MTKTTWAGLAVPAMTSTVILFLTLAILPDWNQSNLLLVEAGRPLTLAGLFSLIAGYVASGPDGRWRSGSLGGALNALLNLGMALTVASTLDRHFVSIGGRSLIPWFPLAIPYGVLFGLAGAGLRRYLPRRAPAITKEKSA
jgi:hypothetical protein